MNYNYEFQLCLSGFVSLASYGPQVNALYLQEHITNGTVPDVDYVACTCSFLCLIVARSDMTNIITGVDGQLYHGSDHAAFLQPPGVGRQGVNQRYPYTQNTGYDSNPYGSPRQRYVSCNKLEEPKVRTYSILLLIEEQMLLIVTFHSSH